MDDRGVYSTHTTFPDDVYDYHKNQVSFILYYITFESYVYMCNFYIYE